MGPWEHISNQAPGVYLGGFGLPDRAEFRTGVPVFIGVTAALPVPEPGISAQQRQWSALEPRPLTLWSQYRTHFGSYPGQLSYAVRGFFENGGHLCYVAPMNDNTPESFGEALARTEDLEDIDLVCAPDVWSSPGEDIDNSLAMQRAMVKHCDRWGTRFAILDSQPGAGVDAVILQRQSTEGRNAALYYPWLLIRGAGSIQVSQPPCGHVAGVYTRCDEAAGVHKAPANEVIEAVLDLEQNLGPAQRGLLNSKLVNCLCSFPGRGIRVWGARTVTGEQDWSYISIRRIFISAARWLSANMQDVAFEPNTPQLWARIEREVKTYFLTQYRAGALKGRIAAEAFFVRCDETTNTPESAAANVVVTEIGLAPSVPGEFVIVRLVHGETGVRLQGPARATEE